MDSPDDWLRAALGKKSVADAMVGDRKHCREAWFNSGMAIEFALKARIMRERRLNRWPDRSSCPELHTHDLRALFSLAGIDVRSFTGAARANLMVVLTWTRGSDYEGGKMPRKSARDMHRAAFDPEYGVFTWLTK